jgi:hypothetical protein
MKRDRLAPLLVCLALILGPSLAAAAGGSGYFSREYNWKNSPSLYYTVAGGPPNTCGDLWTSRNGAAWINEAGGWLCTDSSGNQTKGPWSWANQPRDETAYVEIRWPDGTRTTTARHVWDKTCPTVTLNPTYPAPTGFRGWAQDALWGAGFDARWTTCQTQYQDADTGLYLTNQSGGYASTTPYWFNCTVSGMPSMNVTWFGYVPPLSWHDTGHCYWWTVCISDGPANEGGCRKCVPHYFCP